MDKVLFTKLHEDAIIPRKRKEDAGYDLYGCVNEFETIYPGETVKINTGIASVFSSDYVAVIKDRSSLGGKSLHVAGGVIDSGYRGEWAIQLTNATNNKIFIITKDYDEFIRIVDAYGGDHIRFEHIPSKKALAQVLFLPVPKLEVQEITPEELENYKSERGTNGFGSTDRSLNENYGSAVCGLMPATK